MKIVDIREVTLPISSPIRNAYIDFSKMTLSLVAVITDVIRDGRPVVGYGFNSNGRYGQGKLMRERMRAIAAGLAASFEVEIDVDIRDIFSVLVNSEEHAGIVAEVARGVVGAANVSTEVKPKMGSEDFADMLKAVPGAYFWLGHAGKTPVHNPGFVLDDAILPVGASLFSRIIETRLKAA